MLLETREENVDQGHDTKGQREKGYNIGRDLGVEKIISGIT